ncbi:hypothetical protein GIB67_011205 [Kingdonia uniflora]|uniref:Uncharacterized protein n=1 Tax=Kingdonia uniflora TaxID=39325 RepID=A0A7J7M413_9MAGN|nr:hypothetical protein GIB67_011205 [Kingdonia uniflora]
MLYIEKGRCTGVTSKLLLRKLGLYRIIRRYGENVYDLYIPGARSKVVNVKLLTQFYGDIPSHPVTPALDVKLTDEIDEILDSRLDAGGHVEFLTQWVGRTEEYDMDFRGVVLSLSLEGNLKPKYLYLVNELRNEVKSLTKYPMYLSLSLEQRIRPRHKFLVSLKKAPKGPFPLSSFIPTDESFCQQWAGTSLDRYVAFKQSFLLKEFAKKYERK